MLATRALLSWDHNTQHSIVAVWAEDENLCEFEGQNTYHDEGVSAGQS